MSQREDALKFETSRIKALQEERLHIQKKTFTKWMNSFLQKARMEVEDLFTDLSDGKKLLKLLEIISGEKLGKPNNGRMRVHKIENVNKSLAFLHSKVRLESIGAEDIVDGNRRLILGLIWTIILRFQIQEIEIDVNEDDESSEKKSAKDALLLWCQRKTTGYNAVNIQDFTVSWRNGLGFNALIHSHRPDIIDYDALVPHNHIDNLNNAFDVGQKELGIAPLLDAEDVDTNKPDEKSVITYVASYYHTFAKLKSEMKGGRRIANIVNQLMEADKMKNLYETYTTDLLTWIQNKVSELEDRNFPNTLDGIQGELLKFKQYRTIEKPPKYKERSEIEAVLFDVQTKLKALGQPLYLPSEGKLVNDIEKKWSELEKSEHNREVALRAELLRQERLEQLAYKFERKSVLREGYLREMIQVLSDPRYGSNLAQVEATVKKHEAISADILSREERFHHLTDMCQELINEDYHDKENVKKSEEEIMQKWEFLLELLEGHKVTLTNFNNLMTMLREIDTITAEIKDMEANFHSEELGKHLLAVEDLLQKHNLMESQVTSQGETIEKLNNQAQSFIKTGHKESAILEKRLKTLNDEYHNLVKIGKERTARLGESCSFYQFVQDHDEEEAWIIEKQRICKAVINGKDLSSVLSLQQKHKALEDEVLARQNKSEQLIQVGEDLVAKKHPDSEEVKFRLISLHQKWQELHELLKLKHKQLDEVGEAYQFYADTNEAESWMKEKIPIVSSQDYGKDEPSAQALLQRHGRIEGEIKSYEADIQRLNENTKKLIKLRIASLPTDNSVQDSVDSVEYVNDVQMVPTEIEEDEVIQKDVVKDVVEEKRIQQVRALYPFSKHGIEIGKGEVLILLEQTNNDWWNVRKNNGQEGYVPANYVKEIEPRIVRKITKQRTKVPEKIKVKKTVLKKQVVQKKVPKKSQPKVSEKVNTSESVQDRQATINRLHQQLLQLSQDRRHKLEDSIRLFAFYRECDGFLNWMSDKEKMLTAHDAKDSVEAMKRKFENFLTDMSTSARRLEDIDFEVGQFAETGHSQMNAILAVQKKVHDRWKNLNFLKTEKEKSLEGATSVELFNRTCDDASDWMLEKMEKMDVDDLGRDMKTVQALQRKHQNVERELAPVEEKFNRVNLLAESVKNSYPNEKSNIATRQKELQEIWNKVKAKASERRSRLDESLGLQIFNNNAKTLLSWVSEVKQLLNSDEPARDVTTAENLLKIHGDLEDDIWAHQDEFKAVQELGSKLLSASPNSEDLKEKVVQLHQEQDAIYRGWQEKGDWLRQCMDLQLFNREADQIDSITHNQNTFLEFEDLGSTLDDVEALLKRHEDFENTFIVQDERLKSFSEMADKLIKARHYDSQYVDERRHQVLSRRNEIQDKAGVRKAMLLASLGYQEFKADADEFSKWIQDKLKTATDESYRDLSNLERKLKKHEAFEAELKANEDRLNAMNKAGNTLLANDHYASPKIQEVLKDITSDWNELCRQSNDRGEKLRQAVAQHTYNRTLEDAKIKLDEMESMLASDDTGNDLRSVKTLMKNHQLLEKDMSLWDQKINEVVNLGNDMATNGHFDAPNILNASKAFSERFSSLKAPALERKHQLQESFKFHSFNFEIDTEMQWIQEHMPAASSTVLGQNLIDAQNYFKKHQKLELEVQSHQSMIDKTIDRGKTLIDDGHIETSSIQKQCEKLNTTWDELIKHIANRKKILELSLRAQQFLAEANEVELWMNEKNDVLSSSDLGRDEDAVIKLLTKQKALELEIDTYDGLITEMASQAQQMIDNNHPDSKVISSKQQIITQQMKNLQKLANIRRKKLMESKHRHEFFRETADLEEWIVEQMQLASSEDYGQDFEHLLLLQSKFDDFKHQVETGSERFTQCEELCKKLVSTDTPFSGEILSKEEHLRSAWATLLDHIEARDQKLQAAGEIHRFNRDVADALQRIQEKYAGIPDDLGKDLNSVLSLIRKHEGFENDLVALEAQLQILIDDSARLQAAYPGGNAEHILEQQNIVVENWNTLQERAAQRKAELQLSCDLQRFFASVRDLESWSNGLRASMTTEEKVRDMASAQILKTEHENLKAEIEAREESFKVVVQAGELMIQDNHYAKSEIRNKLDHILEERSILHSAWQHKKVYLDQLIDLQFFMRDAKQLDSLSTTQEAFLSGIDYGATVDEVDVHVKKHEAFNKLMSTQDEKLEALQEHGKKLIEQNHFDQGNITARIEEVFTKRVKVKDLSSSRKVRLSDALLYAQFKRDVAEAENWIDDKKKHLEAENMKGKITNLEEKIKILQKHQAFQAELTAHEGNIIQIKEKGETLLAKKHEESPEIHTKLKHLLDQWNSLLQEVTNRGRGLEEAHDILEFNNQVEKVEAWIRDKDMMVQAGDVGRDYEHCMALQRKLDDVDSDMRVDDARVKKINGLADKLIRQGRSDTRVVQQRREELNQKWRALQGALNKYRDHLGGALEIHAFNRDIDDTNDRINEKAVAFSADDYGKDLAGVEALQRKQDAIERDMTAIEGKLKEHDIESRRLIQKYPDMSSSIRSKLSDVQDNWRQLNNLSLTRKQKLSSAYTLQKFMTDLKELETWVNDMISKITIGELANNTAEAESMLELHQERKAEIDGRQETFKALKEFGHKLVQQRHYAMESVEESIVHLEELRRMLIQAWEEKKQLLTQCRDLQIFKEVCEKADNWLQTKEAFLNNEDLGESMSSVEALIRKHVGFEKTMLAQEEKIDALEKFSTQLITSKHYDSANIQSRSQGICQRRDRLKESSMVRNKMLLESKQLQQFLRNIYEVVAWIHEKIKVANDESYRDPTNLQSKMQKHQAFEAELTANKSRVNSVNTEGEQLIGAGHFASMEIQTQLNELESQWRQLLDESLFRRTRLQDAYQALVFSRTLDDLDSWMDETENHLQSEDHGKDLKSVQNLLKKQLNLETDVHNHAENITQVKDTAANFQNANHFMNDEIQEKATLVIDRYASLHEPLQIRRENLEDSLQLHQYYRDVEDEMSWIREKESLASSEELGSSLFSVQNLQKKHQALEAEIQTHEPLIAMVTNKAQQMLRSNHFAASEIEFRLRELKSKLQQLKDQASVRRLRLLDAEESHMFYSEINEAEAWIKEKLPLITSTDVGKDEDSVLALIKKFDGLQRDIEGFNNTINKLANLSQGLIDRGHFDSENIKQKQAQIERSYLELEELSEKRHMQLQNSRKLHKFLWECDELREWIKDQMAIADSEDYGKDVEHVEMLMQKFESFINGLHSCEMRVASMKSSSETLFQEINPKCPEIAKKYDEVEQAWEELKEITHNRQEALAGARQVHVFDRNADETISWIQEKEAVLSSEDYGHDLESIQIMIRKHDGFERDLAAVKKQFDIVIEEAEHLASLFPDARDHISVKHGDAVTAWNQLLDDSAQRSEKLKQAEQLQSYFDEYRELLAWINEMMAIITSDELARDVASAEALVNKHKEHKAEINTRTDAVDKFTESGRSLINNGHFMADEIEDKINRLDSSFQQLLSTWQKRKLLYDQNLDTQLFLRDADQLELWIKSRESVLSNPQLGDSITAVEELLRKHDDFEKTIDAQAEKFDALKRTTLLEKAFKDQKIEEEKNKKAEAQQREHDRLDAMKRKEQNRILDERRREDERRKTQEIVFKKPDEERGVNGEQMHGLKAVELPNEFGSPVNQNYLDPNNSPFAKRGESLRLEKKVNNRDSIKRAESMKPKRNPSFTTRKKSLRRKKMENLPPVEMEGFLDRKQELQNGGKKATIRSWKGYYTVLCGQLLCFFKDKNAWIDNMAAAPPLNLHLGQCTRALNYTKKKHVFRLQLSDGSEYLFTASTDKEMEEWMNKLSFHAALHPSKQLMSYDIYKESSVQLHDSPTDVSTQRIISSSSSPASSPEMNRTFSTNPGVQDRNNTSRVDNRVSVKSRIELFQNQSPPTSDPRYQNQEQLTFQTFMPEGHNNQRPNIRTNGDTMDIAKRTSLNEDAPPLPISMPPEAIHPVHGGVTDSGDEEWSHRPPHYHHPHGNRRPSEPVEKPPTNAEIDSRYLSLPQNTVPPVSVDPQHNRYFTMDQRMRMVSSEGSSESELSSLGGVDNKKITRDSKKKGFTHYFKKKKGTHL